MRLATTNRVCAFACALTIAATSAAQPSSPTPSRAPTGTPPAAGAATTPAPGQGQALAQALTGPAKDAYESARLLAMNHDFSGALTKFRQAHDLSSDPRLLFDMAVCEKNLRHYARTQSLLERYLHEGGTLLTPESRATAEAALGAIRNLVGTAKITVSEAGATVLVDSETVGVTPLSAPFASDLGKHALTVRKPGFVTVERPFETAGGSEIPLDVTLEKESHVAKLVVMVEQAATVSIDGNVVGAGRYDGQLPSGPHDVRVTEPGKQTYRNSVDLRDGETRTVQVTLENEKRGSLVPWVIGGAVVVVGAAVGGYFLLKPQDQTTPPPAGKLGSVSFASFR